MIFLKVSLYRGIKFNRSAKVEMRVIYFSQDYTPHDYRFLAKLARSPYEVWHLRFETNPTPFETRPLPSGVKKVDWLGSRTYQPKRWHKVKLFRDFKRVLRQLQPHLIHAGPVPTCGFFVALSGFRPFFLMSWGSDILAKSRQNIISQLVTRFTIKRADMIAGDCLAVRDRILELADYPADRIIIFPWGVDLDRFHPVQSPLNLRERLGWRNNKVVISTRSFEPVYGIEVFLKAAKRVIEKNPEVRFLMLGDGSMRPQVQDFITLNNLGHAIYLAGRVDHDQLPDYFNEADLYVSSSYSDGTSVSLLEAMACKLPVIVTDLSSNREWVQPGVNGWLIPPGDSEALGLTILEALGKEEKAKDMGEENIALIRQKADWQKNSDILLAAYQRLIKGKGK